MMPAPMDVLPAGARLAGVSALVTAASPTGIGLHEAHQHVGRVGRHVVVAHQPDAVTIAEQRDVERGRTGRGLRFRDVGDARRLAHAAGPVDDEYGVNRYRGDRPCVQAQVYRGMGRGSPRRGHVESAEPATCTTGLRRGERHEDGSRRVRLEDRHGKGEEVSDRRRVAELSRRRGQSDTSNFPGQPVRTFRTSKP